LKSRDTIGGFEGNVGPFSEPHNSSDSENESDPTKGVDHIWPFERKVESYGVLVHGAWGEIKIDSANEKPGEYIWSDNKFLLGSVKIKALNDTPKGFVKFLPLNICQTVPTGRSATDTRRCRVHFLSHHILVSREDENIFDHVEGSTWENPTNPYRECEELAPKHKERKKDNADDDTEPAKLGSKLSMR